MGISTPPGNFKTNPQSIMKNKLPFKRLDYIVLYDNI